MEVGLLFLAGLAATGHYACDRDLVTIEGIAAAAKSSLSDRYTVYSGSLVAVPTSTGGAVNPSSRYLSVHVDRASFPDGLCALVDKVAQGNCVQHPALCNVSLCNAAYTLAPTDALVWLGCTPPPSIYFSWQSYVLIRLRPKAFVPWAEYGDTLNHVVLNTSARRPWNSTSAIIVSADARTIQQTSAALVAAGLESSAHNFDVINASLLHLERPHVPGLVDRPDFLQTFVRVAEPASAEQLTEYLNVSWPVLLLRAREEAAFEQHAVPPLRNLKTGVNESALAPPLAQLREAVLAHYGARNRSLLSAEPVQQYHLDADLSDDLRCLVDPSFDPEPLPLDPNATTNRTGCGAATRDCLYTGVTAPSTLFLTSGRVLVLLGVNHRRTRKSAYGNLMLSAYVGAKFTDYKYSVTINETDMQGSAHQYVPELPDDVAQNLFAVSFARDCSELGVSACKVVGEAVIGSSERLAVLGRDYLDVLSAAHPDFGEMEPSQLLILG